MALTYRELEAITNDYFLLDSGAAVDIYFNDSFLLNRFMKQGVGIWERPEGGLKIRIPLEYDGQEAGFYAKGDTLSSDDRNALNSAYFEWKHAYSNATIYRLDGLQNAGRYAEVQLLKQRLEGAQKSIRKVLAGSIYDTPTGNSNRLSGLLALCNTSTTVAYGGIAEDDLVAADGTKPWKGRVTSTTEALSLPVIRTMAITSKVRDGAGGKIDLLVTTEALFAVVADILQIQQRFTSSDTTAKAGFTGLVFEGKDIFPDDYCPSGYMFGINSRHLGFAVHKDGLFMRTEWRVIEGSPEDKTMKIYWDGNLVCNNRKAMIAHSNLS